MDTKLRAHLHEWQQAINTGTINPLTEKENAMLFEKDSNEITKDYIELYTLAKVLVQAANGYARTDEIVKAIEINLIEKGLLPPRKETP